MPQYADDLRQFDEPQSESGSYFPALAAISGRYQAPPPNPGLGAFMDDPFERAAYRVAGRQVGPPERGTDADIAQAAMVMAPAPLRAVMSAPKIATAGLAAYNFLSGTDSAGGAPTASNAPPGDPQAIMKMQEELRPYGYTGPIDGIWKGGTQRAYEAKQQADQLKVQQDAAQTERDKVVASKLDAEARTKDADARAKETERQRLADEETARRKREGDERMRDIEKNISPTSRAIRDYSGPIGVSAGAVIGSGARYMTQKISDFFTKETAKAGNAIMAAPTKTGAASNISRASRANDFWRAGGAKEVPFTQTPTKAPGFEVNPKASNLKDIYNPQIHPAVEVAAAAPAVLEEEVSRHYRGQAEEELAKAIADAKEDPSEINIQRIQTAKDQIALTTGFQRAGMMSAGVQGVGAVGSRFMKKSPEMRPNMGIAEQEQLSLQKILRDASERATKKAGKSSAPEVRSMQGPVTAPPGFTGPNAHKARTLHNF